ncbi:hypothetical protein RI065_04305 [Mycoplasmatota bacterium zrk1]
MKNPKEWRYTGQVDDLGSDRTTCEWCGQNGLRYKFEIENKVDKELIYVGSECINKFDITVEDERGRVLAKRQSEKRLMKDKNRLIKKTRHERVINAMLKLANEDASVNFHDFISYYKDRNAFTPNQLSLLLWKLKKNNIEIDKKDFQLILRRNREKDQLISMPNWKVEQLWDCMSSTQKDWYKHSA